MNHSVLNKTVATASISHEAALALSVAARSAARDLGIKVAIAITDGGGHLKHFESVDGVPFLAAEVATDKAWTAASFGVGTHDWNTYVRDAKVAPLAFRPRLVAVGGGVPILQKGQVVGGIGISGGTADQDQQIAEVALRALGFDVPG